MVEFSSWQPVFSCFAFSFRVGTAPQQPGDQLTAGWLENGFGWKMYFLPGTPKHPEFFKKNTPSRGWQLLFKVDLVKPVDRLTDPLHGLD